MTASIKESLAGVSRCDLTC